MADYTDDFNRANESPLASPWATGFGASAGMRLLSNAVHHSNDEDRSYYNDTFADDQYSASKLPVIIQDWWGVTVRDQTGANSFYYLNMDQLDNNDQVQVYKVISGSHSAIGSVLSVTAHSTSIVYKIQVVDDDFEVFDSGVSRGTRGPDTSLTSGKAGIYSWNGTPVFDDWEGGDVGPGAPFPPWPKKQKTLLRM